MISRYGLPSILAGFVLLALAYSVIVPLGEAPDEVPHFSYIQYLTLHHQLPLPEGQVSGESHQPPLYYLIDAAATAWIPQRGYDVIANPDFAFDNLNTPNLLVHDSREAFPYRDDVLAWHIARALSVVMGAVTVWATWKIAHEIFPNDPMIGLGAAAFVAFLPGFVFICAVVNNDNLIVMLSSLCVLQVVRMRGAPMSKRDSVVLGVLLGLAALTKLNAFVVWFFVAATFFWTAWKKGEWKTHAMNSLLCFAIASCLFAPWVIYNWVTEGDPLAWSLYLSVASLRPNAPTFREWVNVARGLFTSFWGRFGGALHLALSNYVYVAAGCASALALLGWLANARDWMRNELDSNRRRVILLLSLFWIPLLVTYARWAFSDLAAGEARLLFPGLPLLATFFVVGWAHLFKAHAKIALTIFDGALGALAAAVLVYLQMVYRG